MKKKPRTIVTITPAGEEAVERHWHHLDRLRLAVGIDPMTALRME